MKFNLKEINWGLILVLFVVTVAAAFAAQLLTIEETVTEETIDGSVSTSTRKLDIGIGSMKKEEAPAEVAA